MSISRGVHRDVARQDGPTFCTVPAVYPSGHECKPQGAFSYCHLDVEKNGDVIVVRLGKHQGLDELTATKIRDELLGVVDRPDCHRLLVDCAGVAGLSSATLATLLMLRRKMEHNRGKLSLCGLNTRLRSVFASTGLDRLFDVTDTATGALTAVALYSFEEEAT